jgi:hypothetical protein
MAQVFDTNLFIGAVPRRIRRLPWSLISRR